MHKWLDEALPRAVNTEGGQKLAIAAPRGEAKTTFVALFFALWCILTGRKKYIVLIADALDQACAFLEAIKVELENNPRLAADFPQGVGDGRVWNVGTIITSQNVKVQAFGAGKRMRGLRHGAYRPDLVILDDLENDENVRQAEQRDKLEAWLTRTVLPLGAADGSMDVVYIGTILHYDSVLARTLQKPQWISKKFKALIEMPDRLDIWDVWESVLFSDGEAAACQFFEAKKEEMERGAKVSWPGMRPLYSLMCQRAENRQAFDAEMQNDPLAADAAPFAEGIQYWTELPEGLALFGACDPSLGKAGASRDPSAILVGAWHKATSTLYVLEARIRKRHPNLLIEEMISLQKEYKCLLWAVETVQFQEFFADVLIERSADKQTPMPVKPIKNNTDKLLRIESLQPYCVQGRILLHKNHTTLVEQLRHFPMADHDDGPDALEMLWRVASTGFISITEGYARIQTSPFFGAHYDFDDEETGW